MAVLQMSDVNLGLLAQIVFSDGVRNQLSENFRDFELVKAFRAGKAGARSYRFMLQESYGPAAVQWRNASSVEFPSAQEISISEKEAFFKELDATIRIRYNIWKRLQENPEKYGNNLELELKAKQFAVKRRIAADLYDDGTGVLATITGAAASGGKVTFSVNPAHNVRGFIGRIEKGDLLLAKAPDTTARTPGVASGTFYAYKVLSVNRSDTAPTFLCVPVNSAGAELSATNDGSAANADVIYRVGQPTFPDLTAISGSTDYGTLTDVMAGLPTLISADGRKVHGITMSGSTEASVLDLGGSVILDSIHIHQLMDKIDLAVGQGRYKYSKFLCAHEALRTFVEAREPDRRFHSVQDGARGTTKFIYQYGDQAIEFLRSEFCPIRSMWVIPDTGDVIKLLMSDMEMVKEGNGDSGMRLEGNAAGYNRAMVGYLHGCMTLINEHPAATGRLTGFALS